MNWKRVVWLMSVILAATGCRETGPSIALEEIWSGPLPANDSLSCDSLKAAAPLDRVLDVSVYIGNGVDKEQIQGTLGVASVALANYGITLQIDPAVQRVPKETLYTIDPSKLRRKINKGASQAKLEGLLLQGIKVLLQTHCRPRVDRIHFIFLREIAPDKGIASRIVGDVAGIGLSPELVAAEQEAAQGESWVQAAGLGGEFTPTLILSTDALARLSTKDSALMLVHELGHAMGLSHTDGGADDLMSKVLGTCLPEFNQEQREAFVSGTRSK